MLLRGPRASELGSNCFFSHPISNTTLLFINPPSTSLSNSQSEVAATLDSRKNSNSLVRPSLTLHNDIFTQHSVNTAFNAVVCALNWPQQSGSLHHRISSKAQQTPSPNRGQDSAMHC